MMFEMYYGGTYDYYKPDVLSKNLICLSSCAVMVIGRVG